MNDTELLNRTDDADDDVVVYVPKKKSASKVEYIDDEGVRVVADTAPSESAEKLRPAAKAERAAPLAAVRGEPVRDHTRRMSAFSPGAEAPEEPVPVARRERGKTTKRAPRGFAALLRKANISPRTLAGATAAIGVIVLVLAMVLSGGKESSLPGVAEAGFVTDGGAACAPLSGGKYVTVEGDAEVCTVSPDKKSLVVQEKDGALFFCDTAQQDRRDISGDAQPKTGIVAVRNSGVLYITRDGQLHRFTFSSGADHTVGGTASFAVAKNTLSVLYSLGDKFYILPDGAEEAVEAGGYSGTPRAVAVSDDGRCAVWTDWSNNAQNIYLYDLRGRSVLETLVGTTAATKAVFSENGKFLTVTNPDGECAYLWNNGTVSRAKLGGTPVSGELYTVSGLLGEDGGENVGGVYVHVSGSAGGNIYYLDLLGDREKLISKVRSFQLRGGVACFTASDGNMYYVEVSGANASERVRISADVQSFILSRDGKYVYYLKDVSAGVGNLYVYRIGDEEPVKIASEASGTYLPCENGSSVIYYREGESTNASGTRIAVMYLYSFGEGSNKIASDAVIGRVSSGSGDRIEADSFTYLKYLSSDSAGRVYSNCVYFDGKESSALLKDVYYDAAGRWTLK